MTWDVWALAAVLTGPVVGSFVGLVSLRLPEGRPVMLSRSACGGCGRTLGPVDLAPLLSFAALRGRCRTCRAAIPRRYPLIEGACLLIGAWAAWTFPGPLGFVTALFGWSLLMIAVVDAEHLWLPDRFTLPLGAAGLIVAAALEPERFIDHAVGAAAGWAVLAGVALAYRRFRGREGLGGGDPRLLGALGAWTGWAGLPSVLLIAAAAGLTTAAALSLRGGSRLAADARLPFGTFLAIGGWLVWLYGPIGLAGR